MENACRGSNLKSHFPKKRLLADDQHRPRDTYPGLLEAGICAGMLSTLHTYASMGLGRLPLLNSKQQERNDIIA